MRGSDTKIQKAAISAEVMCTSMSTQLWLNLPSKVKMKGAGFIQMSKRKFPRTKLEREAIQVEFQHLVEIWI